MNEDQYKVNTTHLGYNIELKEDKKVTSEVNEDLKGFNRGAKEAYIPSTGPNAPKHGAILKILHGEVAPTENLRSSIRRRSGAVAATSTECMKRSRIFPKAADQGDLSAGERRFGKVDKTRPNGARFALSASAVNVLGLSRVGRDYRGVFAAILGGARRLAGVNAMNTSAIQLAPKLWHFFVMFRGPRRQRAPIQPKLGRQSSAVLLQVAFFAVGIEPELSNIIWQHRLLRWCAFLALRLEVINFQADSIDPDNSTDANLYSTVKFSSRLIFLVYRTPSGEQQPSLSLFSRSFGRRQANPAPDAQNSVDTLDPAASMLLLSPLSRGAAKRRRSLDYTDRRPPSNNFIQPFFHRILAAGRLTPPRRVKQRSQQHSIKHFVVVVVPRRRSLAYMDRRPASGVVLKIMLHLEIRFLSFPRASELAEQHANPISFSPLRGYLLQSRTSVWKFNFSPSGERNVCENFFAARPNLSKSRLGFEYSILVVPPPRSMATRMQDSFLAPQPKAAQNPNLSSSRKFSPAARHTCSPNPSSSLFPNFRLQYSPNRQIFASRTSKFFFSTNLRPSAASKSSNLCSRLENLKTCKLRRPQISLKSHL
ncbi:hypothetical protein R3P38DRAFT_3340846 [Favolaschia claudopus]|uniref:Uncharacterized protein n=1 Tax=Favolaschia claudopus TaxID=2862362 RepID=A0AAW0ECZ7_9AGAR